MTSVDVEPGVTESAATPVIEARDLSRHFRVGRGFFSKQQLHAVDNVSFSIGRQEIVALAGESGSGKSTIARLLAGVYKPTGGEIFYQGRPMSSFKSRKDQLSYRGDVPMVFQDPFSSLNPAFRVSHGVLRSLKLHRPELTRQQRQDEAAQVIEAVGLTPAGDIMDRYPYELSGGQRQRIGFAQALAHKPKLILADEPVSMLDVSIRIGLLNLMAELRSSAGVSFLYITHDIASARYVADRLMIMYAGHIVETGPAESVLANPKHPYTDLLLGAVPDPRAPLSLGIEGDTGEPPKVVDPTPGCRFRWRCPLAIDRCHVETPVLRRLGENHEAACHVAEADAGVAG
ncbi:ABC transporter ATP-binding protein [Kribbella kalugense]|uniref:Peptide/nickel transport system ATP-binding protein n=1 Tax=Kribbella kalugense TaxID=2512221 RepID=A0A4R7ZUR4_9ACTN|nr:ABC transporter ATP-binding protein [Kribbella kalugense]TDW21807.1 peptide/nickel transport system ATP-binding protein [Kribbella kalugense]